MTRPTLLITLALLVCCGGTAKTGSTTGSGEPLIVKKVAVSWGIEKQGEMADLFLATTDETGKQVSHPLGRYKGDCKVFTPPREMNAATGLACRTGATGTEIDAVIEHGQDIVVLQSGINEGVKPDPMSRQEIARVKVPLGAKIEVAPAP
jgi:hypothetical protein